MSLYSDVVAAFEADDRYVISKYNTTPLRDARSHIIVQVRPLGYSAASGTIPPAERVEVRSITGQMTADDPWAGQQEKLDEMIDFLRSHPEYYFFPLNEPATAGETYEFKSGGQQYAGFTVVVRDR